jgi:hypothetical protein
VLPALPWGRRFAGRPTLNERDAVDLEAELAAQFQ